MFENSRKFLETYFFKAKKSGALTDRTTHVLLELRGRLRQLQYSYKKIRGLSDNLLAEQELTNPGTTHILVYVEQGDPEESPDRIAKISPLPQDELIVLLESFYYSAHRCVDLVNDHRKHLPGLGRVKAKGIVDARNHLIEHTNKKNGNPVFSFQTGPSGPRLRALSWSKFDSSSNDPGLWANADEFQDKIEASLRGGIEHLDD